jgi:hypothetical protein
VEVPQTKIQNQITLVEKFTNVQRMTPFFFYKLLQRTGEGGTIPKSFYEANLDTKTGKKNIIRKLSVND